MVNSPAAPVPPGITFIETFDEMPRFTKMLFSDNEEIHLSDEEKKFFLLVEGLATEGERKTAYLIVTQNIPSQMNQRAKTFGQLLRRTHSIKIIYTTRDMLKLVEDHVSAEEERETKAPVNETELYNSINDIFTRAVQMNASDIHIEAFERKTDVKFRVNGMLVKVLEFAQEYSQELVRILYNVLAVEGSKDIQFDEHKMQAAIVEKYILGKSYRVRLQTAPRYPYGYSIALRLLPLETRSSGAIEVLGYTHAQVKALFKAGMKPTGALIFAGTTGSGKSTTLANLITDKIIKTKGVRKVITIENPPEYVVNGALQININDASDNAQSTFADAIKVAMRMDPDVLMIGEVRDPKTAKLLQDSVQSGHQVFTTVHAQSALGIFERLVGLGFERNVLTSPGFLSMLMYQVLVPINCPHCAVSFAEYELTATEEAERELIDRVKAAVPADQVANIKFRHPEGCDQCQKTGFLGRSVVAEFIEPDDQLLAFIAKEDYPSAREHWQAKGGVPIYFNIVDKMKTGELDPHYAEDKVGYLTG
jgi:type II secretory ATPase GspE/PulE/Tfp pilus assembly ATPase PilB-like protein